MAVLVDASGLVMTRPGRTLFADLSLTVHTGDRIGVVGLNGTGKSTLLRVLAGLVEPEEGTVRRGRDCRIALLGQRPNLPDSTVAEALDGSWESAAVLDRLGMGSHSGAAISSLSGGEAKRVALARTLVTDAELLLLDEPTNHLDIDAIAWLEDRLAEHRGGLVVVTHDRHILDRVTTRVLELDRGTGYIHEGGYQAYLEGRARREDQAETEERSRRNLARRELAWLRRGAPARTRKSKAHLARAHEILEAGPAEAARAGELDLHLGTPRLGDQVIELEAVGHRFDAGPWLFRDVELALDRRERLGVVGLNGSGKSTLLDVMAGRTEPAAGAVRRGSTVRLGIYDQLGADLDPRQTVRAAVTGGREPTWRDRALLERFWFDRDAQYAPIELLSGGERRRLQLLLVLAEQPNVLLLDEPTNDLDLDTLRVLEDFLDEWPGALVVVSHDRAFLERTVDDVIVLDGTGSAGRVPGGYGTWEAERRAARTAPRRRDSRAPRDRDSGPRARSRSTLRHLIARTEAEMHSAERRRDLLQRQIEEAATDHEQLAAVGAELATTLDELVGLEDRWLALAEELDGNSASGPGNLGT